MRDKGGDRDCRMRSTMLARHWLASAVDQEPMTQEAFDQGPHRGDGEMCDGGGRAMSMPAGSTRVATSHPSESSSSNPAKEPASSCRTRRPLQVRRWPHNTHKSANNSCMHIHDVPDSSPRSVLKWRSLQVGPASGENTETARHVQGRGPTL